ncbi:MAG: Ig-like domain-containing protein, partial [bacterium]
TQLVLSKSAMTLNVGKTDTVTWAMNAEGSVNVTIQNTAIAEITKISGKTVTVKAKSAGTTALTASMANGLTAQMTIAVEKSPTYLRLPEDSVSLIVGQTYAIRPDTDANALTYSSGKSSVATVSNSGVVTAVGAGSADITVHTANNLTAKLKVTVLKAPEALSVSPSALTLSPYEYCVLKLTGATGTVSYASSDGYVAYVSKDGVVTGIHGGECTITATDASGQTATCRVTVVASDSAPAGPASAKLRVVNASTLEATWDDVPGADSYRVYLGTSARASEASLYQSYDGWTRQAEILGVTPDTIWHIFVTACNSKGETPLTNAAHALARTPSNVTDYRVSLNYSGSIMLALGAEKTLSATVAPSGYTGGFQWASSSDAIAIAPQGNRCAVIPSKAGEGRVSVTLDNGMAASLYVRAVDTSDLSDANFTAVQKAVMQDEALMNADEGGNVIWDMVRGKLADSGMKEANVSAIVDKVQNAEALFRNIYICALGAYDIVAEATRDKWGTVLGVSQFLMSDNALYLVRSTSSANAYAYTALHETGHAVDYNGSEHHGLLSENDSSTAAILSDVRQLLLDRMDAAIEIAGARKSRVSASNVADAVLDYRTLLDEDAALSRLNSDERDVYYALTKLVSDEMNAALTMNNGTMVWDAIEGATNFAVSGKYGHSYLLDMPQYKDIAKYYFYDSYGNPTIAGEPWAEYFSANIMQDAATLAVNLAWLPKTCKYFGETLAPRLLDALKGALEGR